MPTPLIGGGSWKEKCSGCLEYWSSEEGSADLKPRCLVGHRLVLGLWAGGGVLGRVTGGGGTVRLVCKRKREEKLDWAAAVGRKGPCWLTKDSRGDWYSPEEQIRQPSRLPFILLLVKPYREPAECRNGASRTMLLILEVDLKLRENSVVGIYSSAHVHKPPLMGGCGGGGWTRPVLKGRSWMGLGIENMENMGGKKENHS